MNLRKFGVKLLAGLALLSATAPTTAAFAQEDKEPILVGANYELSGYSASYGVALFEALELAVEQVNANGGLLDGRPVELVYADNQSDKTETVSVATKLIEDGVVAIVGPGATDVAMVQSQIIEDAGVPTLIPAATADHLTTNPEGDVYNYLFRLASTYTRTRSIWCN